MKKSISFIILILVFALATTWAETVKEWCEKGVSAMEIEYYNVAIKCFEKALFEKMYPDLNKKEK